MGRPLGYCESSEVKLIRKRHIVTFGIGSTAGSLGVYMVKVPTQARLVDIEHEDDSNIISLVFEVESEEE